MDATTTRNRIFVYQIRGREEAVEPAPIGVAVRRLSERHMLTRLPDDTMVVASGWGWVSRDGEVETPPSPGDLVRILPGARYTDIPSRRTRVSVRRGSVEGVWRFDRLDSDGDAILTNGGLHMQFARPRHLVRLHEDVPFTTRLTRDPEPVTESTTVADSDPAQERTRNLVRAFYNEGMRHGYGPALVAFKQWFETTTSISLVNYAGIDYQVQGTFVTGAQIGSQHLRVTAPVNSVPFRSLLDVDQAPGWRLNDAFMESPEGMGLSGQDYSDVNLTFSRSAGSDPVRVSDPESVLNLALVWIGERAQEDGWCSEYEAFCRKQGVEPLRGGQGVRERTYAVVYRADFTYSATSGTQDRVLVDVFTYDGSTLAERLSVSVTASARVVIEAGPDGPATERAILDALANLGGMSGTPDVEILSYEEVDE